VKEINEKIKNNRLMLKPKWTDLYNLKTAKRQGLKRPDKFLRVNENKEKIALEKTFPNITQKTLTECIKNRRSLREYKDMQITLVELSYLLWETCRVDYYKDNAVFRTIPTAGATNSMETYVYLNNVKGLEKGIYHYLQDLHELSLVKRDKNLEADVNDSLLKQLRGAQLVVFFTAFPARTEYKYDFCAHKIIAMEAGHACQNLSLAAEVIDAGICAICAYNQTLVDKLLDLDGDNHFVIYCATVGKKKEGINNEN
jgi:SagB-type dehydrogenase family enzyme